MGLSTLAACVWAFWGIVENFHEGWYYSSLWANLGLMLSQYVGFMLVFVAAALVARIGPESGVDCISPSRPGRHGPSRAGRPW